jgi:Peptidase family S51
VIGLLSSDEFTSDVEAFDVALLEATGPKVAILLCADPRTAPAQAALAKRHYEKLGAEPRVLDVLERSDGGPGVLPDFDLLFIGGGSPSTLLDCLSGTPLWQDALERWTRGTGIAGSSAGAMVLCAHCLVPEPGADMPTRWSQGIGPTAGFGLAVHASGRPPNWLQLVSRTAPAPVIAMDAAAGLILGTAPRAAGRGRVWVADEAAG